MHDRGQFWSPVPEWSEVALHGAHVDVGPVAVGSVWLVSGDARGLLARHGIGPVIGPREMCSGDSYALRLAPDRLLFVGSASARDSSAEFADDYAATDVSDGVLIFDILGAGAADLMAQGSEYRFDDDRTILAHESATMQFAGFRLSVSRRERGWRLHIERPWAPALWRWLRAQVEAP